MFLVPIANPTWKDFVLRVGALAVVFILVIKTAQAFMPGHEGTAVMVVALAAIALAAVQEWRYKKRADQSPAPPTHFPRKT